MMFTLIAVALGGYVMIESAPDFSNYAVLTKNQQFDRNLARLRRVTSSRQFYLTTAEGMDLVSPGDNPPNSVLTQEEIFAAVSNLVTPGAATVDSTALSLGTTPRDPFIPSREWPESFWAASYNFVKNPAFYNPAERESKDPGAVNGYYVIEDANGNHSITRFDRFGRSQENILSADPTAPAGEQQYVDVSTSVDGTRVLAVTTLLSADPAFYDVVSFDTRGANRAFATAVGGPPSIPTSSCERVEWSPNADKIAFVRLLNKGPPAADDEFRIIIQTPERSAVPWDPIYENQVNTPPAASKFPNLDGIGRPRWSPDGNLLAFSACSPGAPMNGNCYILVYDFSRLQWAFPRQDGNGGVFNLVTDNPACLRDSVIAWGPKSNRLVYQQPSGQLVVASGIKAGPSAYLPVDPAYTFPTTANHQTVYQIRWAPNSLVPEGSENNVVLYLNQDGDIIRKNIAEPAGSFRRVAGGAYGGTGAELNRRYFEVSPGGTKLIYMSADRKGVHVVGLDGYDDREIIRITAPGKDLTEVGFMGIPPAWIYPKAGVRRLSPADLTTFDSEGWRKFTSVNSLFRGDSRFGRAYLQVRPPQAQGQFFFDNGTDGFRIDREDPTVTAVDTSGGNSPKILGKGAAAWDWRGSDFFAREMGDVTGGDPSDYFKQTVDQSGTTVLVTTGSGLAVSPDNQLIAVSKLMSPASTFPPDTSQFPVADLDVWVMEGNGGPDPPPTNLTPDTTDTAESAPSWSPDGRFVYFQREFQPDSRFIGNHASGIYRASRWGGSITRVAAEGSLAPAWNGERYISALEFYEPAVSPDGTRVAFVARERLLGLGSLAGTVGTTRVGEVVGSAVYVKDLIFNTAPVCLLRSYDSQIAEAMIGPEKNVYMGKALDGTQLTATYSNHTGNNAYSDHDFHRPSWSSEGQEIFVNRTYPMNNWFPKKHFRRPGNVGPLLVRDKNMLSLLDRSQIIRIKATHPWNSGGAGDAGITQLGDESFDPPLNNFDVIVQNKPDTGGIGGYEANPLGSGPGPVFDWTPHIPSCTPLPCDDEDIQILRGTPSVGATAFQRIQRDSPSALQAGASLFTDYVLSGYVRSKGGLGGLHSAQIMASVLNNQGLLVDLENQGSDRFQIGIVDVGGEDWTRFSAALRFGNGGIKGNADGWGDNPPYTIQLMLYSLGGVGASAEFTGIKMEKAYEFDKRAPTAFYPGWVLHSSSDIIDPSESSALIYER